MKITQIPTPLLGGPSNGGSVSLKPALGTGPKGDTGVKGDKGDTGDVTPAVTAAKTDAEAARDAATNAKTAAETARDQAVAVGNTNDTIIAGRINDPASATRGALNDSFAAIAGAGTSDDTTRLNALLAAGGTVRGKPGTTYTISAPLVIGSNTTLDMSGCTVRWKTGTTGDNLVRNVSATPQRSITDAAMTSGSTTLTSATAAFTSADVGRSITVYTGSSTTLVPFTADIASVTDASTVVLAIPARATGTGLAANIHNRDKHLRIVGGTWDRGAAVGSSSLSLHTILCHFADDVTITPENILSTATGAKFAINLAAVTNFKVRIPDMDVVSDGLHITGPASRGDVPLLSGKTGDDMFAITGADYPGYQPSGGDVTDVHVGSMLTKGSLAGHKILAGYLNRVDNIKIDFTAGSTGSYAAWVGADQNYLATTGGTYGRIDLGVINVAAGGELVKIVDCDADKIICQPIGDSGTGQKIKVMQGTTSVGGTVKELVTRDARAGSGQTLVTMAHSTVTVKKLVHDRPRVDGTGLLHNNTAGTVTDMVVNAGDITYTGSLGPIYGSAGTVSRLALVDTDVDTSASTGVGAVVQGNGATFARITTARGNITGGGSSRGFLAYAPSASVCTLVIDNTRFITMKRVGESGGGFTVYLTNPVIESSLEPFHASGGGATIVGHIAALITATKILTTTSVGTLRVNGSTLPVDVSTLTPTEGDQARNISAAAGANWYVGPVVWDSTASLSKWTPLRGYTAVGTATLVGGTVTVADTKITTNSQIVLFIHTPMANMGAPFVSGKTAGTGFTISSTNAADTSVIRYKILTY